MLLAWYLISAEFGLTSGTCMESSEVGKILTVHIIDIKDFNGGCWWLVGWTDQSQYTTLTNQRLPLF